MKAVWVIVAVFVFTIQEIRSDSEATDDSVKFIAEYFLNQENSKSNPQTLSDDQNKTAGNKEKHRNGEQDQLQMNLRSLPLDDEVAEDAVVNEPNEKKKKMITDVDQTLEQIRKLFNVPR